MILVKKFQICGKISASTQSFLIASAILFASTLIYYVLVLLMGILVCGKFRQKTCLVKFGFFTHAREQKRRVIWEFCEENGMGLCPQQLRPWK